MSRPHLRIVTAEEPTQLHIEMEKFRNLERDFNLRRSHGLKRLEKQRRNQNIITVAIIFALPILLTWGMSWLK